jgi:glycine cleavage system H protein
LLVAMATVGDFEFPDDLLYLLEQDTWVRLDADGNATVGITSLGAHISGAFIEFMPKPVGTRVERDRALGLLEMSKVIRSVRAPVGGLLLEANPRVTREPGLINASPYREGWLVRLQPTDWEHERSLLVTAAALPDAVRAYMALLSETFGVSPPP